MIDLQTASFFTAGLLILIGLGAVVFVDNILKKIMGAMFITDGVNLALVSEGYHPGGIIPILPEKLGDVICSYPNPSAECVGAFAQVAGYPLPYALVLTNIVIGVATTGVMLALVIKLHQKYKTLSTEHLLGGEETDE